jgi:hypothetical protein
MPRMPRTPRTPPAMVRVRFPTEFPGRKRYDARMNALYASMDSLAVRLQRIGMPFLSTRKRTP